MNEQKGVVAVGQIVPNFEMEIFDPQTSGFGKLSLEGLLKEKKWVVLCFYPADYTFICPTELADLEEKYDALKKQGAEVVSVSTDTKFVHLAWKQSEKLLEKIRFPMAADPTGKVSRLFGVYDEGTGLALRGTFVINPDGKLVSSEVHFYNVGRNMNELIRKVSANVHVSNHSDEVCPSGWETGGKTLKPGPQMVGKVYEALKK